MKKIINIFLILFMICVASCQSKNNDSINNEFSLSIKTSNSDSGKNNLIVYFTYSGNTEKVAKAINNKIDSTIVKIISEIPYTKEDVDYTNSSSRSQVERKNDARPKIKEEVYNYYDLKEYNNIFIGYPIWNGYAPMIIKTYIEHEFDKLLNKSIYVFSTSASSSGNFAFNELKDKYKDLTFIDYLHLTSSQIKRIDDEVNSKITIWKLNDENDNRKISLNFNNQKIIANLGNNKPANDLISRLKEGPITLTFNDFGESEKIAYPNPKLEIAGEDGYDPNIGDIVIYKPWNNIAIFYKDSATYSLDLIYIGSIEKGSLYLIEKIEDNSKIVIKKEKN